MTHTINKHTGKRSIYNLRAEISPNSAHALEPHSQPAKILNLLVTSGFRYAE